MENRVLSYCKLPKQEPDMDGSGDCPQASASTLVQGRECSPPGEALPTAQTSRRSADGFPADDLSSARSRSLASGAVPRKGAGNCWGVRCRRDHLPRNAQKKKVSVVVALLAGSSWPGTTSSYFRVQSCGCPSLNPERGNSPSWEVIVPQAAWQFPSPMGSAWHFIPKHLRACPLRYSCPPMHCHVPTALPKVAPAAQHLLPKPQKLLSSP